MREAAGPAGGKRSCRAEPAFGSTFASPSCAQASAAPGWGPAMDADSLLPAGSRSLQAQPQQPPRWPCIDPTAGPPGPESHQDLLARGAFREVYFTHRPTNRR